MPRRRSIETMDRDAQAADLYRKGLNYRQIAAQMGWKNQASAFEAVRRSAADASREANAEVLQILLDRLQDYRRAAWRVLSATHVVTSASGKIIRDENGHALTDHMPVLHALDRLHRYDIEEAKLRDLYPAAKSRVEIITSDTVEANIALLESQLAVNDPADTGVS
jgi:hypothetical protein